MEDACQAEEDGKIGKMIVTFKEEEKSPATKFKLPPVNFEVWDGKQEKFFAWMSSVIKLINQVTINDGQAQLMVLKKILENIRNQCEHLTSFTEVKRWLMGRYGTDNGLLAGVASILKKVTKTECMIRFFYEVMPEI